MKGASTGILPNQVKRNKEIKIQIAIPLLKIELFLTLSRLKGKRKKIVTLNTKANTPPSLLGIQRKIA
jgi:hypothetical protein